MYPFLKGKSSVCLICMKYRIIILIIIIISLGTISLSYMANTSRTHAHTREHAHPHPRPSLFSVRPTMTPSWLGAPFSTLARQCRSLAIQINRHAGDPISPRFLKFFAYKKIARPNLDVNSWQNVLSDNTIS